MMCLWMMRIGYLIEIIFVVLGYAIIIRIVVVLIVIVFIIWIDPIWILYPLLTLFIPNPTYWSNKLPCVSANVLLWKESDLHSLLLRNTDLLGPVRKLVPFSLSLSLIRSKWKTRDKNKMLHYSHSLLLFCWFRSVFSFFFSWRSAWFHMPFILQSHDLIFWAIFQVFDDIFPVFIGWIKTEMQLKYENIPCH